MDYSALIYDVSEDVATITLNRPDNLNGLTAQMRAELTHAIKRGGDEARVILLTGAGRGFCSGQDLGDARNAAEIDLESTLRDEYEPILHAIENSDVPIIAAVNGPAAGAGANIALASDIVIAARSAYFMEAFSRIGLMPDAGGTYHLPRLIGLPRAMAMSMFAEPVYAPQAADWGLIWEAIEDEALMPRARELALRLASGPTRAYAAIRKSMRASLASSYYDQLALEARVQGELGRSRDFAEGVQAFLDKRAPDFEGR
ncbi:MAG: enoyl-CoA hydratase-related protein [Pseudomonadota bacterium]